MTKSRNINRPKAVWTPAQDAILRARYPHEKTENLIDSLGKRIDQIYGRAAKLGLKKSPEYLASPDASRLRRGDNIGVAYRFVKGKPSWNKGVSYQPGGACADTQFKPGHLGGRAAEVIKPIGAERISKDGYLQRKVNNDMPFQRRWKAVHIIVWEETNGPLPAGHALVFRNRDKTDIRIDNLELITRADLMRRNTYHNYGKDIAQLVQLKGAITRQINRKERSK